MKTIINQLLLTFFAVICLVGCATPPIVVSDSQLNWLEIKFRPVSPNEKPCKINLIGVGYIDYIEGTSPRVASDFAINTEEENWQDAYQERLGVQPSVLRAWFQRFADAGLMTEAKRVKASKEYAKNADLAIFIANINREKSAFATTGESLTGVVRDLIRRIKNQTVEDIE